MVEYRKSLSPLKGLTTSPKTGPISDPFQTPSDQMTPTNPPGCRNPQHTICFLSNLHHLLCHHAINLYEVDSARYRGGFYNPPGNIKDFAVFVCR